MPEPPEKLPALLVGLEFWRQPVVCLKDGHVRFSELLARKRTTDDEVLTPGAFMPQIEEAGLTRELANAALASGTAAAARGSSVSVNLPRHLLGNREFVLGVREATETLPAGARQRLVLEVTESGVANGAEKVHAHMLNGLRLALDDFGQEASDLISIATLPVSIVKFDKAFATGPASHRTDGTDLLPALARFCREIGVETVCEGVETEADLRRARRAGCDMAQGYYLGRPVPSAG